MERWTVFKQPRRVHCHALGPKHTRLGFKVGLISSKLLVRSRALCCNAGATCCFLLWISAHSSFFHRRNCIYCIRFLLLFWHEHKHQETLFFEIAGHSRKKVRNSFDGEAALLFACVTSQWSLYSWNITYQSCEVVFSLWYEWKLAWQSKGQKGRTDTSSGKTNKTDQEIWVKWWKSQLCFCAMWTFAVILCFTSFLTEYIWGLAS